MASATAFGVVKATGAGYLIYLGLRTLFSHNALATTAVPTRRSSRRLFVDGVLVSALNPKIAVFFLAFLPQFVDPSLGPVPQQIFVLGLIYVGLAVITDVGYALLAGSVRYLLRRGIVQGPIPRYVSGSIYLGLGVSTALTGRRE